MTVREAGYLQRLMGILIKQPDRELRPALGPVSALRQPNPDRDALTRGAPWFGSVKSPPRTAPGSWSDR
jgi:hypothetical protein